MPQRREAYHIQNAQSRAECGNPALRLLPCLLRVRQLEQKSTRIEAQPRDAEQTIRNLADRLRALRLPGPHGPEPRS